MKRQRIFTCVIAVSLTAVLAPHWLMHAPAASSDESKADSAKSKRNPQGTAKGRVNGQTGQAAAVAAASILKKARDRLNSYRSIKARLIEEVSIGGRRFKAQGSYLQGANLKLKIEFTIRLGNTKDAMTGSLLQVCDGEVLFTRHLVGPTPRITRRDVRKILSAAEAADKTDANLRVLELGLGGLPAMLASIEESMSFDVHREEQLGGKAFVVLEGGWNERFLKQWQGDETIPKPLPDYVPERVRLYFYRDSLFPRRIQYLKRRPMVTLDFLEIKLNDTVNDEEFVFIPPDEVRPTDITDRYIQALQQSPAPSPTGQANPEDGERKKVKGKR